MCVVKTVAMTAGALVWWVSISIVWDTFVLINRINLIHLQILWRQQRIHHHLALPYNSASPFVVFSRRLNSG